MKRFLCAFIALMLLLALPALAEEGPNLVVNGDFSEIDALGMPKHWIKSMWFTDEGISNLYVSEDGYDGNCIVVVNADANDARFTQTIDVEPNSVYRFSCMVKADNCGGEGYGATLSFENTFSYSESVLETQGEWRELSVYGRTTDAQTYVTLMARVGGYSSLNTGRAYFDDIRCVKVDEADVPEGAQIVSLEILDFSGGGSEETESESDVPARGNGLE